MIESERDNLATLDKRLTVMEEKYSLTRELAELKTQDARIISEIESEKGTMERVHATLFSKIDALDARVRKTETLIATGIGITLCLQVAIGIFLAIFLGK